MPRTPLHEVPEQRKGYAEPIAEVPADDSSHPFSLTHGSCPTTADSAGEQAIRLGMLIVSEKRIAY